jgi:hypothetical protein
MAMQEAAVTRIVAVSAAPLFTDGSLLFRAVLRRVAWALFGAHYADLERMERCCGSPGWTGRRYGLSGSPTGPGRGGRC